MRPGHEDLQRVLEMLMDWRGDIAVLVRAAEAYWTAAFHAYEWPEHLRKWHDHINAKILIRGPIAKTVTAMNESEARQTATDLRLFAEAALSADPPAG